jgi:hypothetical protein
MADLRLPDFIIGGAPRSGTTWLYTLLSQHPRIYMAQPVKPEPKFFLVDEVYQKGLNYYSKWFQGAAVDQVAGEKSTNYLESATAAGRIKKDLPWIKLIFILREPVERAYSNYLWSRMNGLEKEDFATALSLEQEREKGLPESLRYARPYAYFSRGLYANMLAQYLKHFSSDQILCLKYEDISDQPEGLICKLSQFLEIDLDPESARTVGTINPSVKDTVALSPTLQKELEVAYSEPNRQLADLLGSGFEVWKYK